MRVSRSGRGDVWLQVIALLLLEFLQQFGSPWNGTAVVRLIAEEAQNDFAELIANRLPVGFMRDLQEGAGGLRIQVVDEGIEGILGSSAVLAIEVPRRRTDVNVPHKNHLPIVTGLIRGRAFGRHDPLELEVRGNRN